MKGYGSSGTPGNSPWRLLRLLVAGLALVTLPALNTYGGAVGSQGAPAGRVQSSEWPTSGWATARPEDVGMNGALLNQARNYALLGGGAGIVVRHGKQVLSWGDTKQRHDLKSTTKGLVGATMLGLAVRDGLVQLEDAALLHLTDFGVPPSSNAETGWLEYITIEQLATHTAGFDKPGGHVELVLPPGGTWSYSDGGANWLADVLTESMGQDLRDVLFARVLGPLGIKASDFSWRDNAYRSATIRGIPRREFAAGISASVDAMARIGYLYLRDGQWEFGQQLLPTDFIDRARQPAYPGLPVNPDGARHPDAADHYGLLWWNNADETLAAVPSDAYWAWGLFDSLVVVIPSLDIVAARAGEGWRDGWNSDYNVLAPFLEPLVESVE